VKRLGNVYLDYYESVPKLYLFGLYLIKYGNYHEILFISRLYGTHL